METGKYIVLTGNLSRNEAQRLTHLLNQSGIDSYPKEEGYGNMLRIKTGRNSVDRHAVFVHQENETKSLQVLETFRQLLKNELKKRETICSACGRAGDNVILKPLNLLQKLYYFGTRPKVCRSCGNEWL